VHGSMGVHRLGIASICIKYGSYIARTVPELARDGCSRFVVSSREDHINIVKAGFHPSHTAYKGSPQEGADETLWLLIVVSYP